MKIGYRTLKTAVATPIAVFIAQLLGVTNVATAGVLAILCIQPTRKKSVKSAWERFIACIIGAIIGLIFYELFGYTTVVIGLVLIVFIPLAVVLKIENGILTSIVIILNMYTFGKIELNYLYDQIWLIIIGIGTGLLANLYMPSLDKTIEKKQLELEDNFQRVFAKIAVFLQEGRLDWNGHELTEIERILEEGKEIVSRDKDNHFFRSTHSYSDYFLMREKQFELIQRMMELVVRLSKKEPMTEEVAAFFERLSRDVQIKSSAESLIDELKKLKRHFAEKSLPQTEREFEDRANLLQLIYVLKEYVRQADIYNQSHPERFDQKKRKRMPLHES